MNLPKIGPPQQIQDINNRIEQTRSEGTNEKISSVSLEDHDEAIISFFNDVIKPQVEQNGSVISVETKLANMELWKQLQQDGYHLDENGKILLPCIIIKRNNIERNSEMGHKIDGSKVNIWRYYTQTYSSKNPYLNNIKDPDNKPEEKIFAVAQPDYITINYEGIIQSNYLEHNNKLIEYILYWSNTYWGIPGKYKFLTKINSFEENNEFDVGRERIIITTFNLEVKGYLLPNIPDRNITGVMNTYTPIKSTVSTVIK